VAVIFEYSLPQKIAITPTLINQTLREVQRQLRSREINGGKKKFNMELVCDTHGKCGTAACIGGWASILLTGTEDGAVVGPLFSQLIADDLDPDGRLDALFHNYDYTYDYNNPAVAARAIDRYFNKRIDKDDIWPEGEMPQPKKKAKGKAKPKVQRKRRR
jgi:hypothetical protein